MKNNYTEQFRQESIQYVLSNPNITQWEIAKQLGIAPSTLSTWLKNHSENHGLTRFSGFADRQRISELEKKVKELTELTEALKKVHLCFLNNIKM